MSTPEGDGGAVPSQPETPTQKRVLDAFTDDDPRPTAVVADRVGADEEATERALRTLERQGVLERRERDGRTTLWLPARSRGDAGVGGFR